MVVKAAIGILAPNDDGENLVETVDNPTLFSESWQVNEGLQALQPGNLASAPASPTWSVDSVAETMGYIKFR